MPVSEQLFSRKLKEIEHCFKVSFTRRQRDIWYARLSHWNEERFAIGIERLICTIEERWRIRDGNIFAMLSNLTRGDARTIAAKHERDARLEEERRNGNEIGPPTEEQMGIFRKLVKKFTGSG